MPQVSRVILTQAASHCVTPARAATPAYKLHTDDLPACRVAGRCDDDESEAVELLAASAFAPLPRAWIGQRHAGMSPSDGRDGRGSRAG